MWNRLDWLLVRCLPYPVVKLLASAPVLCLRRVVFFVETSERVVALSLDDGPDPAVTPLVLDVLSKHDARATFFLIGSRVVSDRPTADPHSAQPVIERIADEGHELGNHSWTDERTVFLRERDLEERMSRTERALAAFGPVRLYRPGGRIPSCRIVKAAERHGYRCVLGSLYPNDVRVRSSRLIVGSILSHVRPGAIIILHEGRPDRKRVIDMLDEMLTGICSRGYRVTTVSDLLSLKS